MLKFSDALLEILANPRPARSHELIVHNPASNTVSIAFNIDGTITDELGTLAEFLEANPNPNQMDLARWCRERI
jgi:hypothetical protein